MDNELKLELAVIDRAEDLAGILPEWCEFLEQPVAGNSVHNHPRVVAHALSNCKYRPLVCVARRTDLRCLAPFCIEESVVPIRLSVLNIASPKARVLKLLGGDVICRRGENVHGYADTIFQSLRNRERDFDLISIYNLSASSTLWWYLVRKRFKVAGFTMIMASPRLEPVHCVELAGLTFEKYVASLGSGTRHNLRRKGRKLAKEHGSRLWKVETTEQIPEFLNALDHIYSRSWQARTYGYASRKTEQSAARLRMMADQGWLRSYVLFCREQPVAFELGFQYQGTYYGEECGYDPDWSNWSPGGVLLLSVIEDLFQTDSPRLLDFGFGDAEYKRSFSNSTRLAASIYLVRPGRWRLILMAQRLLNLAFLAVRSFLVRTRTDARIRRLLKKGRGSW